MKYGDSYPGLSSFCPYIPENSLLRLLKPNNLSGSWITCLCVCVAVCSHQYRGPLHAEAHLSTEHLTLLQPLHLLFPWHPLVKAFGCCVSGIHSACPVTHTVCISYVAPPQSLCSTFSSWSSSVPNHSPLSIRTIWLPRKTAADKRGINVDSFPFDCLSAEGRCPRHLPCHPAAVLSPSLSCTLWSVIINSQILTHSLHLTKVR